MKEENKPRLTDLSLFIVVDFAENTHLYILLTNFGETLKKH